MSGNEGETTSGNAAALPEYVTTGIAAKVAGVPARTVRYWATNGKVGVRPGVHGRLVRLADVRQVAAASSVEATPEKPAAAVATQRGSGKDLILLLAAATRAKDQVIAAKDQTIAEQQEALRQVAAAHAEVIAAKDQTIGELRRRAELAEAEAARLAAEHVNDRLHQLPPAEASAPAPRLPWWRRIFG